MSSARSRIIVIALPAAQPTVPRSRHEMQIDVFERRHLRAALRGRRRPAATSARDERRRIAARRPATVSDQRRSVDRGAAGRSGVPCRGCAAGSPATRTITPAGRQPLAQRRRAVEREQPLVKHGDAVGQPLRFVEIVRRDEDRASCRAPLVEQASDAASDLGIEARGRLVEQQDRRRVQQRARQRDLLPHALSTARPPASTPAARQLEGLDRAIDRRGPAGRARTGRHRCGGSRAPSGDPRVRATSVRKPMRLRSALPVARVSATPSIVTDAAGRRDQPRQHPHRRRLAGAVGAEQRDDLALRDLERHIVDDGASRSGGSRAGAAIMGGQAGGRSTGRVLPFPPRTRRAPASPAGGPLLAEEQAVRREDAGAAELDRADLVAVAIVDVGVRHDERDPEVAGAIDRGRADRRRDERQFAFARLPLRPGRRQAGDELVDLAALRCAARRRSAPAASYFWNTGSPVWKTKKKPPVGSTSGRPLLSARCTPRSSSWPVRRRLPNVRFAPPCSVYSVISAPVSGCDIRIDVPVYCSEPMPFSTMLPIETRGLSRPGSEKPPIGSRPA